MSKILYGAKETYIDVTKKAISDCIINNHLIIPAGDYKRDQLFTDPLIGTFKCIVIQQDGIEYRYDDTRAVNLPVIKIVPDAGFLQLKAQEPLITVHDAIFKPHISGQMNAGGAVYTSLGALIPSSLRDSFDGFKDNSPTRFESTTLNALPLISEPSLYLGYFANVYGHFIVETLARFWIFFEQQKVPIKFTNLVFNRWVVQGSKNVLYQPLISFLVSIFKIKPTDIIFPRENTRFKTLHLPAPALLFRFDRQPSLLNKMSITYDGVRDRCRALDTTTFSHSKIYLSRGTQCTRVGNHLAVEKIFAKFGFHIILPRKENMIRDISLYSKTEILAAPEGTGTHNSVFMTGGKHLILLGSPRFSDAVTGGMQPSLNKINNLQVHSIQWKSLPVRSTNFDLQYVENSLIAILKNIFP